MSDQAVLREHRERDELHALARDLVDAFMAHGAHLSLMAQGFLQELRRLVSLKQSAEAYELLSPLLHTRGPMPELTAHLGVQGQELLKTLAQARTPGPRSRPVEASG